MGMEWWELFSRKTTWWKVAEINPEVGTETFVLLLLPLMMLTF